MKTSLNKDLSEIQLNPSHQQSLLEIFHYCNFKNVEFIRAMDKLDELMAVDHITPGDIEVLTGMDIHYQFIRLVQKDFLLEETGLRKFLMITTLKEAYERSRLFFEKADAGISTSHLNSYKLKYLKAGYENGFMLDYLLKLELNLKRFRTDYQMNVFFDHIIDLSSMFNIQQISLEAQNEQDAESRKKVFVDAMSDCELFCLGLTLKPVENSMYHEIITKCREAIKVIEFQIQNTPQALKHVPDDRQSNEPAVPLFKLAAKKKTDFIKIVSAMYDTRMFETEGGYLASNKQELMNEFGKIVGENFDSYSVLLSKSKSAEKNAFLKPFKDIENKGVEYYDKEYDK